MVAVVRCSEDKEFLASNVYLRLDGLVVSDYHAFFDFFFEIWAKGMDGFDNVFFYMRMLGIGEPLDESSVVAKKDEAFRLSIETKDGVELPGCRHFFGEHATRLVENEIRVVGRLFIVSHVH